MVVAAHKINVEMGNVLLDAKAVKQWTANANLSGISVDVGASGDAGGIQVGQGETLKMACWMQDFEVQDGKIADVKGTIHVSDVTKAQPTFDISTAELNADALLASIRQTPETHVPNNAAALAAKTDTLLASGKISAERVTWSPYTGGNATAEIHIYGDRIVVMPAGMVLVRRHAATFRAHGCASGTGTIFSELAIAKSGRGTNVGGGARRNERKNDGLRGFRYAAGGVNGRSVAKSDDRKWNIFHSRWKIAGREFGGGAWRVWRKLRG